MLQWQGPAASRAREPDLASGESASNPVHTGLELGHPERGVTGPKEVQALVLREALFVNAPENFLLESPQPGDGLENPVTPKLFAVPVQAEIANHHPQPRGELRAAPGFEGPQSAKPFIAEPLAHEEKTV